MNILSSICDRNRIKNKGTEMFVKSMKAQNFVNVDKVYDLASNFY